MCNARAPPYTAATSADPVTFRKAKHDDMLLRSNKNETFLLWMSPLIKELRRSDDVAWELAPK